MRYGFQNDGLEDVHMRDKQLGKENQGGREGGREGGLLTF